MKGSTIEKVYFVLADLKKKLLTRDVTNLRREINGYNLCGGVYSPLLRAKGVVKKYGKTYCWGGIEVTAELAEELADLAYEYVTATPIN
jgi:hypothetical protein